MKNLVKIFKVKDEIQIEIEAYSELKDMVSQAIFLFNSINKDNNDKLELEQDKLINTIDNKNNNPLKKKDDFPKIRERLPNNTIDLSSLNIKEAITSEALVRCPSCGQGHCLAIPSGKRIYLMKKDYNKDKKESFSVVAEFDSLSSDDFINMCCKENTNKLLYFSDIQSLKIKEKSDFIANNDTEIFCPVCHVSNTFSEWKDAYENPLKFKEYDKICDVCGGEQTHIIKEGKSYLSCDSCGKNWIDKNK